MFTPDELVVRNLGPREIPSPLALSLTFGDFVPNYVEDDVRVLLHAEVTPGMTVHPELSFEKAGPRARHGRELQALLDATLRRFTTAELLRLLAAADVPHATVGDPATIHLDPQVVANELVFEMDHPAAGRLRQPKPLGEFEKTPVSVRRGAPRHRLRRRRCCSPDACRSFARSAHARTLGLPPSRRGTALQWQWEVSWELILLVAASPVPDI